MVTIGVPDDTDEDARSTVYASGIYRVESPLSNDSIKMLTRFAVGQINKDLDDDGDGRVVRSVSLINLSLVK